MKLLSHLSADGAGLPEPADQRRLALGLDAWDQALTVTQDDPAAEASRRWSATPCGKRLLGSIFGNSPFLSGVAVKDWAFLTRLVQEGADPVFVEIAEALGKRILKEGPSDDAGRIDLAFQVCFAREPSTTERERLLRYLDSLKSNAPEKAWMMVSRVLLNLDEFITRE